MLQGAGTYLGQMCHGHHQLDRGGGGGGGGGGVGTLSCVPCHMCCVAGSWHVSWSDVPWTSSAR